MSDISLRQLNQDLSVDSTTGDFTVDATLHSTVLLSLICNARADSSEITPGDNPRGWWGSDLGSKLWLLERSIITDQTPSLVEAYIQSALSFLIADGVASRIDVTAQRYNHDQIRARIVIERADGAEERIIFNDLWAELRPVPHSIPQIPSAPVTTETFRILGQGSSPILVADGARLAWTSE